MLTNGELGVAVQVGDREAVRVETGTGLGGRQESSLAITAVDEEPLRGEDGQPRLAVAEVDRTDDQRVEGVGAVDSMLVPSGICTSISTSGRSELEADA